MPAEHRVALNSALQHHLPWFSEVGGLRAIQAGVSGNGWSPADVSKPIHLSARTRLQLRIPRIYAERSEALCGIEMDIDGHSLQVLAASIRELTVQPTVYARAVVAPESDENDFVDRCAQALKQIGITPNKLLCGRSGTLLLDGQTIKTKALMVADLSPSESTQLQDYGLGPLRKFGCGLFIAHKDIAAVT